MLHSLTPGRTPLYVAIAELLRQRIVRGSWVAGQRLPTLETLMEEFGVARVTVRQAMALLDEEGLITRRQGRGTFVVQPPPDSRWLRVETSLDALAEVYRNTEPELLTISEGVAVPLLRPGEGSLAPAYRFMRRIHRRDGHAYCVISIHLDERIFARDPARYRSQTVIPLLLADPALRIARARQTLVLGTADMEVAAQLAIPANSPVAEVRRVFTDADGAVVYLGDVTYRGDFVRVEMELTR